MLKSKTVFGFLEDEPPFLVSWSHYIQLMRIENEDERSFYEIESAKSGWGVRTLQRQYNSSLYERLALSRDKESVLRLAKEGNVIAKPEDIIKQPTVFFYAKKRMMLWLRLRYPKTQIFMRLSINYICRIRSCFNRN